MSGVGRTREDFPRLSGPVLPFRAGSRNLPHESILDVVDLNPRDFLRQADAVRFDPAEMYIEAAKIPTPAQRYKAADAADMMLDPLWVDAVDPDTYGYLSGKRLDQPSPGQIKRFYTDTMQRVGLVPEAQDLLRILDDAKATGMNPSVERALDSILDTLPEDLLRKP